MILTAIGGGLAVGVRLAVFAERIEMMAATKAVTAKARIGPA